MKDPGGCANTPGAWPNLDERSDVSKRTCQTEGCDNPHYCKGMCKPCYRRDYYYRNRERELAGMARWRRENYEYNRQRCAEYAERRWGAERAARAVALAERLAASHKTCTRCGDLKPKTEFYADSRKRDGLYSWCKPCFRGHDGEARRRSPNGTRIRDAEKRRRAYADPVRRERMLEKHRRWAKANPEKNREYVRRRQAREQAAAVGEVDYGAVLARDGMWCYLCRVDIADLDDLHFDHVVPLARGGAHGEDNIRPTHARCNQRKHGKLLSELGWYVPE